MGWGEREATEILCLFLDVLTVQTRMCATRERMRSESARESDSGPSVSQSSKRIDLSSETPTETMDPEQVRNENASVTDHDSIARALD